MMNLVLNKKNTKYLKKASKDIPMISKRTLDWNLENNDALYGCITKSLFGKQKTFLIEKNEGIYRLLCWNGDINFYIIEDIDAFLKLVGVEPLEIEDGFIEKVRESLAFARTLPSTGILSIQEQEVFLYDYLGENYENA